MTILRGRATAAPPAATLRRPWARRSSSPRSRPSAATSRACCPGAFQKHEGYLESDDHVMTWAVGHLVQLAEPDEYDAKFKKWRMADLPIVPDDFKLVVRDERSKKQMSVITKLLKRGDVDRVVNACDAGREGELIFAWTFEKAGAKKPVERLWLSSMTTAAIKAALGDLRPRADFARLEEAARSRSEADWIVGMNATRAATIRLRSSFDGAVSLGRVQTPTLAHRRPARGGDPRLQARALLARRRDLRAHRAASRPALRGPLPRRRAAAPEDGRRGRGGRRRRARPDRRDHQAREVDEEGARRRSCTTSPRCSATPTRASASPPGARSPPPSGSTRSTRRSPTRARTRAS